MGAIAAADSGIELNYVFKNEINWIKAHTTEHMHENIFYDFIFCVRPSSPRTKSNPLHIYVEAFFDICFGAIIQDFICEFFIRTQIEGKHNIMIP